MQVRLFKPSLGEEELANIRAVFDRAWLGLGPVVGEFENAWSAYVGCAGSVGVNSGTAALHLALAAYGFRPGGKVLVPAMTFVATAAAALYNRLDVVFVDVDQDTLCMSLSDLERKISKECVAVIPVHFGGHPVAMNQLIELGKKHRLAVIEDCAHCAGGSYRGKKLGTWGDFGCFSFEEKKGMTTGDGGMICSDHLDLIEPLRAQRWVGIDKDTWKRAAGYTAAHVVESRHWYYEVAVLGYKYNMNDLMAAIGLAQLAKLERMNARRRELIDRYLQGLHGCRALQPLLPYTLNDSAYWLFGVRLADRDGLIVYLRQRGIATGVHYMPLPMHPLFSHAEAAVPVARRVWQEIVTLPLHADLSDGEVDYVLDALRAYDRSR
jgi:perosamine synthetase